MHSEYKVQDLKPMDRRQKDLFKWAVQNSDKSDAERQIGNDAKEPQAATTTSSAATAANSGALSSEIIDHILGPDDATLMRYALAAITDPEVDQENKNIAFENFEMLIENLDNANNIENMQMWPTLIGLLDSEDPLLRRHACNVCAVAVQNNPKSQANFMKHGGLDKVCQVLARDSDAAVRAKALFAITSQCRHNTDSMQKLDDINAWPAIADCLRPEKADINMRKRTAFFVGSLLLEESPEQHIERALESSDIVNSLIEILEDPESRKYEDLVEKTLFALGIYFEKSQTLEVECKSRIRRVLPEIKREYPEIEKDVISKLENL